MSSSLSKNLNTRRHDSRAAKTHWIYTTEDVLELYGIAPNTLTIWKRMGLPSVRSRYDLYLGQNLNAFHHWFKQKRCHPLALTEVYCVHCKEIHSLHDHLYHIRQNETGCNHLTVQCPVSGKDVFRIISCNEILLLKRR